MNRPNPFNYNSNAIMFYVSDLERYCNEIEKALSDSYLIDTLNRLERTEKALDLACHYLEAYSCNDQFAMCRYRDQWKEWLMKEEEK